MYLWPMKKLHKTQALLLELLKKNIDNPLTIRELGAEINEDSPGVIYHHIVQLEKKGYLKRNPNNPKDYVVLDTPERLVVYLNKYGTAQCGPNGLFLDGNITDRIPIASNLLKFPATEAFIVEARGDSMEPKIFDGDIVICRKQNIAEYRDYVVCTYKDEVLIKQLSKTGNELILVSLNKEIYPPIVVKESEFKIEGIVKNILHYH